MSNWRQARAQPCRQWTRLGRIRLREEAKEKSKSRAIWRDRVWRTLILQGQGVRFGARTPHHTRTCHLPKNETNKVHHFLLLKEAILWWLKRVDYFINPWLQALCDDVQSRRLCYSDEFCMCPCRPGKKFLLGKCAIWHDVRRNRVIHACWV